MKFSELIERVRERGVVVGELRVGGGQAAPTPWSDGSGESDPEIMGVCEDSRKVKGGDLFVARGGTKLDGAKYIVDALNRGAVAVVAETIVDIQGTASARVEDANLACAVLTHEVAGNPTVGMKMIGITGTKGKTTVAYLMRSVLKAAGFKVGMIGTVEIDDGEKAVPAEMTTPGSVELVELFGRMRANEVTHCVMEVSSHALHQKRVAGIEWAVAIFTNLTGDHLDYHKTMEEYAAAKAILFEGLKEGAVAVVNGDDEWVGKMVEKCPAKVVRVHVETGLEEAGLKVVKPPADGWSALIMQLRSDGMTINLKGPEPIRNGFHPMYKMNTPLVGRHNAYNLVSVVAAAHSLAMPDANFMKGIRTLNEVKGVPGRLQPVIGEGMTREQMPFQVFVDYAHTHDSLANVLTALRATMSADWDGPSWGRDIGRTPMPRSARLICLFGCGGDRDRTKRPKMGAVAERLADVVIVTSDNPRTEDAGRIIEEICAGFSPQVRERLQRARGASDKDVGTTGGQDARVTVEPDRRAAIRLAIGMARPGDVVLLAGKGHENYQIIGTTKHHFDDAEEAENALREVLSHHQDAETPS